MTYYGIVDKIKDEHKNGVYGRRQLTKEEISVFKFSENATTKALVKGFVGSLEIFFPFTSKAISIFDSLYKKSKKVSIKRQYGNDDKTIRGIVFQNDILNNDYEIDTDSNLFYGLFDSFTSKENAFKKLMKSKGGSTLIIIERNSLPKNMHFGGELGRFNCGLYCSHPKNENLLIPLENSNELIKTLILEETLSAYEALGAKKIIIEDKTTITADSTANYKGASGGVNGGFEKNILREKHFGKGTFDKERALKNSLFIHDFPNIKTTLNGRISGNQLLEKFTENVNLNVGLDLAVMGLFKANANFEYNRKWYFEVEFYDKNEL
ncbi:hypothetical protein [Flavobacterium sp. 83]|uniref:hypothetical protein n=1 Tax=Flavobacterium sp. 83 TaxID=1131812 RepID=UPI00054FB649|nr:hypothetical protein [Flavobacterium sp. 83]